MTPGGAGLGGGDLGGGDLGGADLSRVYPAGRDPSDVDPGGVDPGGARPVGLWLAIEVTDFEPVVAFYRDVVGLPLVDGWDADESRGAVFAVGETGRIEIELVASMPAPARMAIEYANVAGLESVRARTGGAIEQHDRGHHGFTATDPAGTEIYLWSEQ